MRYTVFTHSETRMRRAGLTLLDQLLAMSLCAILVAVTVHGAGAFRDRLAVRAAARAVRNALGLAREHAVAGGARTAVRFASIGGSITVHLGGDSLHRVRLVPLYGVSLAATRDSIAYLPSGLGFGAANVSIVLRRGAHADTVTVSRLGRVR
jgi:hypothetical protein